MIIISKGICGDSSISTVEFSGGLAHEFDCENSTISTNPHTENNILSKFNCNESILTLVDY